MIKKNNRITLKPQPFTMFKVTAKMLKKRWQKRDQFSKDLKNKDFVKNAKIIDYKNASL
jgi:hypothetical protein